MISESLIGDETDVSSHVSLCASLSLNCFFAAYRVTPAMMPADGIQLDPWSLIVTEPKLCSWCAVDCRGLQPRGYGKCLCGRARYCSRACQKAHWRHHRHRCTHRIFRLVLRERLPGDVCRVVLSYVNFWWHRRLILLGRMLPSRAVHVILRCLSLP